MIRRVLIGQCFLTLLLLCSCVQLREEFDRMQQELAQQMQDVDFPVLDDIADLIQPNSGPYVFTFDQQRYGVDAGGSVTVHYTLPEPSTVEVLVTDGWSALVSGNGAAEGDIVISAPDPASPSDVVVVATASDGRKVAATLPIMVRDPYTDATRTVVNTMGYYNLKPYNCSQENFQKLADAGLTVVTVETEDENYLEQLEMAHKAGLKTLPIIGYLTARYELYGEAYTGLDDMINLLKVHPATFAYHICDEPPISDIPSLKYRKERIEYLDPDHPVYINLNPDGSPSALGTDYYRNYIEAFARDCEVKFISFDMYPILPEGAVMGYWHKCLSAVAEVTREYGIPFWAFAASCWIDSEGANVRGKPSVENLRLQAYTDMAYGAQMVQYFTIQQYGGTSLAPIMLDGTWTEAYDYLKEANLQVNKRSFVFEGCAVHKTRFLGDVAVFGQALCEDDLPEEIASLSATGCALVSLLENRGNEYVAIVNQSYTDKITVNAELNDMVYTIEPDGSFAEQMPGSAEFTVDEGDLLVIKVK